MAVNPRGGAGASKGSRWIPERLVGPGVIEQNSYFDSAKARLTLGEGGLIPIPDASGNVLSASTDADGVIVGGVHNIPSNIGPGDLMRVVTGTAAMTLSFFNSARSADFGPGNDMHLRVSTENYFVIPPNANQYRFNPGGDSTAASNLATVEFTRDD